MEDPPDSPCCTGCISPRQPDIKILEFAADGSLDRSQVKAVFGKEFHQIFQLIKQDKDNTGPVPLYNLAKTEGQTVTLIAAGNSKKTVTTQEPVDLYRPVRVNKDIIAKSACFYHIEELSEPTIDYIKCQAKVLLYEAFRLQQPFVHVDFICCTAGCSHVIAAARYNQIGNLKLVPYSQNLNYALKAGDVKRKKSDLCCTSILATRKYSYVEVSTGWQETYLCSLSAASAPNLETTSTPFEKSLIVPYWLVGTTADHALANMHVVPLKVSMSISAGMDDVLNVVTIPTLQNNKVVNAGDELLVFDGELQEETRETIEPSLKKPRIGSAQEKGDELMSPFAELSETESGNIG